MSQMLLNQRRSVEQPHLNRQDVPARESRAKDNGVQSYPEGVQIGRDLNDVG